MKMTCIGLIIFMECFTGKQAPIDTFCQNTREEIKKFEKIPQKELDHIALERKKAMLSLRRKYQKFCTD